MKQTRKIDIGNISIGGNRPLAIIAGPCVIENEKKTLKIAERLLDITDGLRNPFIFKASYDKANRTSIKSFRGPGLDKGLEILRKVKEEFRIPILTDVHCRYDVEKVSEVVDIVQIPAYLCRQTDLLLAVAKYARCVNIKKGQFIAPWDIKYVIEKIETSGNKNILVTERGTTFGYNQLVVDMCSLPIMRSFGYPVIFDVTHSLQLPSGAGSSSAGRSQFIPYLARAGVACGCDGIFIEVHPEPQKALSDGPNSLRLDDLKGLLEELIEIDEVVRRYKAWKKIRLKSCPQ